MSENVDGNGAARSAEPTSPGAADASDGYASFRVGMGFAPGQAFAGGLDLTFPRARIAPGIVTRVDGDGIVLFSSRSFVGLPGTTLGLTVDQVYMGTARSRFYFGGGIGGYLRNKEAGFGGKVLAGVQFSRILGAELAVHFPHGQPITTLQVRVRL